jgi:hypothetical protein
MQRLHLGKAGGVSIPLLAAKYVHHAQTVSTGHVLVPCVVAQESQIGERSGRCGIVTKIDTWLDTKGYTTFGREA